MTDSNQRLPEINSWRPQSIRLTAFPVDPTSVDESSWWEQLFGQQSESMTRKGLVREYDGPFNGAGLELRIDATRIRWMCYPIINLAEPPSDVPTLGSFLSALEPFDALMARWLESCPPINRLAFGAVLILPMANRDEVYKLLARYLPYFDMKCDATDFLFQVNRPRPSSIPLPDLKINRLTKWAAIQTRISLLANVGTSTRQIEGPPTDAARLELDISTNVDRTEPLLSQYLVMLWRELLAMGREIAIEGDKP